MSEAIISKPLYRIFSDLTGEDRFDVALHLAAKELLRLKLKENTEQLKSFTKKYGMSFEQFQNAWEKDKITDKYSYDVEKDYWEWEALETDLKRLNGMLDNLLP